MIDILGHLFYAFIFLGLLLLNTKNKWGWICRIIGEIGWLCLGFELELTSLVFWGVLFVLLDIRGFIKWHKEKETKV